MSQRKAKDMVSDWYLPEKDPTSGFIYPGPLAVKHNNDLLSISQILGNLCEERADLETNPDFVVEYDGMRFRGHRIMSTLGPVNALRRIPDVIPSVPNLGLDENLRSILLHPLLSKGGLVLLSGETGQGKSTTCAAVIAERMRSFGSFCLTIEDPPELKLYGPHGQGFCIQTEAKAGEFAYHLKGAMRSYPVINGSILYVGETRDSETATELLRVVTNGHLVFTTMHGSDIMTSISRFITMCSGKTFSEEDVKHILASTLRLVVHQRLIDVPALGNRLAKKKLETEFLFSPDATSPVAQKIRSSTIHEIKSIIESQKTTAKHKGIEELMKQWSS